MDSKESVNVKDKETEETDFEISSFISFSSESLDQVIETCPNNRYQRVIFIQFNDLIRSAPFTKIYRALDSVNGNEVSWVSISLPSLSMEDLEEISSRTKLNYDHKNLVQIEAFWVNQTNKEIIIITEMITGSTIGHYVSHLPQPRLKLIKIWSKGILEALEYLHSTNINIIHGGLASSNICVMSQDGTVKLADYYLNHLFPVNNQIYSNICYLPPETFNNKPTFKSDMYSFGIILLEMCTKEKPFEECHSINEAFQKIKEEKVPEAFYRIKDAQIKEIIRKCLAKPESRPSATDLLNDSFFDFHSNIKDSLRVSVLSPQFRAPRLRSLITKISVILRDNKENLEEISFNFSSIRDTSERVAMEMVETLGLSKFCLFKLANEIEKQVKLNPPLTLKIFKNQNNSFEPNSAVIKPCDIYQSETFMNMSKEL